MTLSPPAAKKPTLTLSSEKQISDLSDADLAAIFERLSPHDRLVVSEVCRRWHAVSCKDWLDVKYLDLGPVRGKHFVTFVRQCPNLRSVFALKKSFDCNELASLAQASQLSTVKLYDRNVKISGDSASRPTSDLFAKMFSENLQHTAWNELILHDVGIDNKTSPIWSFSATYLPASLTRLQLSSLRIRRGTDDGLLMDGLEGLQNLECLILHKTPWLPDITYDNYDLIGACNVPSFQSICALKNMRELCVGPAWYIDYEPLFWRLIASLPKLEVLFLHEMAAVSTEHFAELIKNSAVLRIIVLTGKMHRPIQQPIPIPFPAQQPIDIPARKRFPRGFGSDPLPLLHVFVGKSASEHLRFAQSGSDAALIHPISEPIPAFLEREDIAPIFKGCWVAEKIKETAKNGGMIWHYYEPDDCTNTVQHS